MKTYIRIILRNAYSIARNAATLLEQIYNNLLLKLKVKKAANAVKNCFVDDITNHLQLLQGIENVFIDNTTMGCSSKHKDTAIFLNKEKQELKMKLTGLHRHMRTGSNITNRLL